jgi:Mu-like prophage I protein.
MKKIRTYALANEFTVAPAAGGDPVEIRIPYGEWNFGMKKIELPGGGSKMVFVRQRFDRAAAVAIANEINNGKAAPIYFGHPDVPELAHKYPDKRAKNFADKAEAGENELTLALGAWNESPANGFRWHSPYWVGDPEFTDADNALIIINELRSVALTNNPNIAEFRLANEAADDNTTTPTPKPKMEELIKALGLAEGSDAAAVLAAVNKLKGDLATAAAKAEASAAETQAKAAEAAEAATALANERGARIEGMLDNAEAGGCISKSARPAWKKRLETDIVSGALALANEKPPKTEAKTEGASPAASAAKPSIVALANERAKSQGVSFHDAYAALKAERPDLFKPGA